MELESLRKEIDCIDAELQNLLNERAEIGKKVAEVKEASENPQYFVPERETQILRNVVDRNQGLFPNESLVQIFREIISATRALEYPARIAILGPEGTFTQYAAQRHFGHSINAVFQTTIDDVFAAVESGRADYGVVPVENSTEGVVANTLDCLLESSLLLCGEIELEIHHALIGTAADISEIQYVNSHSQTIAQCRKWLHRNLPNAELRQFSSNAEAVVAAKKADDSAVAAIAGEVTAQIYDMQIIRKHIQDQTGNSTRFLVIGKTETRSTQHDKTSVLLSKQNEPGSLLKLLEPIARHNISMTKIESRPSRKTTWEYVFFIDFEGHAHDANVAALLAELKSEATLFRLLGSYPTSVK